MNERLIELTDINPNDLFGPRNTNIAVLKKCYPKLKIVARGSKLKAFGDPEILDEFEKKVQMLINHFNKYNKLDENSIERIITSDSVASKGHGKIEGVLVHGVGGRLIKTSKSQSTKNGRFNAEE